MGKKLTTKEFIEKSKLIHNNKYDYSTVEYKNYKVKVKIICPVHGIFEQRVDHHLSGCGCKKCGNEITKEKKVKDISYYINKAKLIHGNKYIYSDKFYSGNGYLTITCNLHGDFKQTISNHLKGKGCPKCNGKNKTTEEIINDFINIHGDKYEYNKVVYNKIKDKVKIICPIHGEFNQIVEEHLKGCGCSICKESKGEKEIRKWLMENNIKFLPQHKFPDCKNILTLPFDFYLPEFNTCIEFNGEQHYKIFKYFGGDDKLVKTQKNDKIKMEYCNKNNIPLLIIKYDEVINEVLTNFISF